MAGASGDVPITAAGASSIPMDVDNEPLALLDLFNVVLPQTVLKHLSTNTRKLLRLVCKRLRAEVDHAVTTLTLNRFNIERLMRLPIPSRFPSLTKLVFHSCEPDSVTGFLAQHLRSLKKLELVDMFKYYASIKPEVCVLRSSSYIHATLL